MTSDRMMRSSGEDLQRAVDLLRDAHGAGRLASEEFCERTDAAYAATTWGELDDLTADLPLVGTDAGLPSEFVTLPADRRPEVGTQAAAHSGRASSCWPGAWHCE